MVAKVCTEAVWSCGARAELRKLLFHAGARRARRRPEKLENYARFLTNPLVAVCRRVYVIVTRAGRAEDVIPIRAERADRRDRKPTRYARPRTIPSTRRLGSKYRSASCRIDSAVTAFTRSSCSDNSPSVPNKYASMRSPSTAPPLC
jgi:hypothetical protein